MLVGRQMARRLGVTSAFFQLEMISDCRWMRSVALSTVFGAVADDAGAVGRIEDRKRGL